MVFLAIVGTAITVSRPAASVGATVPLTKFLTATNGSDRVTWADRSRIDTNTTISDGSWSPDGSRVVFVNADGDIETIRYDDGGDTTTLVSHTVDAAVKSRPIWFDNGAFIVLS
jgi:Tol biopolymer transport system component